eukprot:639355-Prymnesium_polylepis.1
MPTSCLWGRASALPESPATLQSHPPRIVPSIGTHCAPTPTRHAHAALRSVFDVLLMEQVRPLHRAAAPLALVDPLGDRAQRLAAREVEELELREEHLGRDDVGQRAQLQALIE